MWLQWIPWNKFFLKHTRARNQHWVGKISSTCARWIDNRSRGIQRNSWAPVWAPSTPGHSASIEDVRGSRPSLATEWSFSGTWQQGGVFLEWSRCERVHSLFEGGKNPSCSTGEKHKVYHAFLSGYLRLLIRSFTQNYGMRRCWKGTFLLSIIRA